MASLYQYEIVHEISGGGRPLKKGSKKNDIGPMECFQVRCGNGDFITDYDLDVTEPCNFDERVHLRDGKLYIDD